MKEEAAEEDDEEGETEGARAGNGEGGGEGQRDFAPRLTIALIAMGDPGENSRMIYVHAEGTATVQGRAHTPQDPQGADGHWMAKSGRAGGRRRRTKLKENNNKKKMMMKQKQKKKNTKKTTT